jgi:hypothetical protein
MSTHINGIVQASRRIIEIQDQILPLQRGPERTALEARYTAAMKARQDLVLAAMRDGVEGDLISWAIGMQEPEARIWTAELLDAAVAAARAAEDISTHEGLEAIFAARGYGCMGCDAKTSPSWWKTDDGDTHCLVCKRGMWRELRVSCTRVPHRAA